MVSTLEKARMYPDSMKAKILKSARTLFGEYGYHGLTTRMIARDVGVDSSTLHYHWGDKKDLYEAVVADINDEVRQQLKKIRTLAEGRPLATRLEIAIDLMCDYLFDRPECARMINLSHFNKTRPESIVDDRLSEHVSAFRKALGLKNDRSEASIQANVRVLAAWNAAMNFSSADLFFMSALRLEREEYLAGVKKTLKSILIPAFSEEEMTSKPGS